MPKQIQPLTESQIFRAEPKKTKYSLPDGNGLHLLVQPTGSKSWQVQCQIGGVRKYLSLGCFPAVSLADARKLRHDVRIMLARDIITGKKAIQKKTISFAAVAQQCFEWVRSQWTERHASRTWTLLEREVFPFIGDRPVDEITAPVVLAILRRIVDNRSLVVAHRVRRICRLVFRFALAREYAKGDPTVGLVGALPAVRHKHLEASTDPKDIASLLNGIDGYKGSFVVGAAIRLAPLLMVRPAELRHAEWSEIDFDGQQWVIPAEKTRRMRESHIVPLSRQAIAILRVLHGRTGYSRFVFPSLTSPDRCIGDNAVNAAFRRMGVAMSGYSCRVMAARILYEVLGCSVEAIQCQLSLTTACRTERFLGTGPRFLTERHEMMQRLADYLDTLKGGAMVIRTHS